MRSKAPFMIEVHVSISNSSIRWVEETTSANRMETIRRSPVSEVASALDASWAGAIDANRL